MSELTTIPDGFSFTIDRSIWLRGEGSEHSRLLRPHDNKMCCVGICLRALGVPDSLLLDMQVAGNVAGGSAVAADLADKITAEIAYGDHGKVTLGIYTANDSALIDDVGREEILTKRFKQIGINVAFEG